MAINRFLGLQWAMISDLLLAGCGKVAKSGILEKHASDCRRKSGIGTIK